MGIIELILIALSLAMDAFAVAMCRGLEMKKINYKHACLIAIAFGFFQALMPLIGYTVGNSFSKYIVAFDHWIAFGLLLFIGGGMIIESFKPEKEENLKDNLNIKKLIVMAIATSIDALAVGVSFAFLEVKIFTAITIIGVITLVLSFIGVIIGNKIGTKFKKSAEIIGGIVLILIGLKILLEHLGVLSI